MKQILFLTMLMSILCVQLTAQTPQNQLKGTVLDEAQQPIIAATISLFLKDSLIKTELSDEKGNFQFSRLAEGNYRITISVVSKAFFELTDISLTAQEPVKTLNAITLQNSAATMEAIVVTAKKPMIEQKAGKLVVNVDASPSNSGITALELLEKSPGVSIDNNDNISLKGKQGVTILIDGKPTYLSGTDLAALLKSMPSNTIDQVELITSPSAKYDAAGNAGIINIKTKKSIIRGMNGTLSSGYTQGSYARWFANTNLNYRNDKLNIFGGVNLNEYAGYNKMMIDRILFDQSGKTATGSVDQISKNRWKGEGYSLKFGVDYNFSKNTVAGIVLNGSLSESDNNSWNNSSKFGKPAGLEAIIRSTTNDTRKFDNLTANFNLRHKLDSTGKEISADIDYSTYNSRSNNLLTTKLFDAAGNAVPPTSYLKGLIPVGVEIYSAKIDYTHPFNTTTKLEAGIKSSWVETNNKVDYFRSVDEQQTWNKDASSNHFLYSENINAAYSILTKTIDKWDLSAGLRLENTIAKGNQLSNDSSFKRNYTNLFPNAGISYNMSDIHQFSLSYARRIQRPNYDNMNPFIYFLDSLTYNQGNPWLTPQFSNNVELSHTFNRFLTTTINYSKTTDIIAELLKQEGDKTFQTVENLSSMRQWGATVMLQYAAGKWWNANLYTNLFSNKFSGIYNNEALTFSATAVLVSLNNNFNFGKGWGAELSGWYRTKANEGLIVIGNIGMLNMGVSKQILKGKGSLKLAVRDALYTNNFQGYARYGNVDVNLRNRRDSRTVGLSFNWRFGKTNIAPERKRGGASDEQNRVKTE